jgi:hypothetical protein
LPCWSFGCSSWCLLSSPSYLFLLVMITLLVIRWGSFIHHHCNVLSILPRRDCFIDLLAMVHGAHHRRLLLCSSWVIGLLVTVLNVHCHHFLLWSS